MTLQQSCDRKFFAVDSTGGAGGTVDLGAGELSKDDIYNALNDEGEEKSDVISLDDKKPSLQKEKTQEKTPTTEEPEEDGEQAESDDEGEEVDELTELEEEIKEPDPDKLELTTPVRRREILAKYPNLFKDFPYLEKAYYREQQFTEVFPTIDDAKLANDKSSAFDNYVGQLFRGDTKDILKTIKAENENSFHQIVDNYLTSLYEVDEKAYYHVLGNINKMTIAHMIQEGKKSGNDDLTEAAKILHQFIFGNKEWTPPGKLAKQQANGDESVSNERQQWMREKYQNTQSDLQSRLENVLTATIDQNIDKTNSMTPYVKKAACQDAMKDLQRLINSDSRFQALQTKLWEAAFKDNFSKASVDRIKSAFTAQAKTLLPSVLKKARNEALRGLGKRVKDDSEDVNDGSTRTQRPDSKTGRTTSPSQNSGRTHVEKAKSIPRGMTTLEFLNKD